MASSSSKTQDGPQTRQKRILPSRARRGGPGAGVGGCEVDQMILETYKRQAENEPLIPVDTPFLLTTDSSQVPSTSAPSSSSSNPRGLRFNLSARERYFDRPEVIKAYKEQLTIQTPEYITLSEAAAVGGRFRPRGVEDAAVDTSDQAYEKRHRKYETFEKRQRLREKEKLKHEQYKLKERIDQLRAMDPSAFMSLPASTFTPPPGVSADGEGSLPGAHINGAAVYNEGERRRKEMLDVALSLEERYRVLLPPDRVKKPAGRAPTVSEPDIPPSEHSAKASEPPSTPIAEPEPTPIQKQPESLKLKIKLSRPQSLSAPPPPAASLVKTLSAPPAKRGRKPKNALKPLELLVDTASTTTTSPSLGEELANDQPPVHMLDAPPAYSSSDTAVLDDDALLASAAHKPRLIEAARPRKRMRTSLAPLHKETSLPPIESISAPVFRRSTPKPSDTDRRKSLLLLAAIRQSEQPKSRGARRHHMAFGYKVPFEVEQPRDFELPAWLTKQDDVDEGTPEVEVEVEAEAEEPTSLPSPSPSIPTSNVQEEVEAEVESVK